jgi:hypothetical protein
VWFLVGGLLMAAAAVIAGVTFVRLGLDIAHDDAVFRASGTHTVTVPAHAERGLFVVEGNPIPRCRVSDSSGAPVEFRVPDTRFTFNGWEAVRLFDTANGTLTFDCSQGGSGQFRIGRVPDGDELTRAGVIGFFVPLAVGGTGFLVVLVTGILFYTRRPTTAYAAPPPGWPPPPSAWPPTGHPGPSGQPGQPGQPDSSDQPPSRPPTP